MLRRPSFIKYRMTRLNNFLYDAFPLPSPVVDLGHLEPSLSSGSYQVSFGAGMVDQVDLLPEVHLWLLIVPGPETQTSHD